LVVRINRENQTLKIAAKVVFAQPGMGMGLAFGDAEPDQRAILDQWIAEQSGEPVETPSLSTLDSGSSLPASARIGEIHPLYVLNELILLLLQKGVLTETEGKSLLQKLLK
jgi:hypothetical protein